MTDRQGWGPRHYECAVREIKALRVEVARLKLILGRIVDGDGDSTMTIRAAREYLSASKPTKQENKA